MSLLFFFIIITLLLLAVSIFLLYREGKNKNTIIDLQNKIAIFSEREKLIEKEFQTLGNAVSRKSLELEEQRNLTLQASKLAALGEMAAGIAHEINNPLTIIASSNQRLRKLIDNNETDTTLLLKYCSYIDNTVLRISKIISGLKTIARDSSNETFQPTKLADIFNDMLSLCG